MVPRGMGCIPVVIQKVCWKFCPVIRLWLPIRLELNNIRMPRESQTQVLKHGQGPLSCDSSVSDLPSTVGWCRPATSSSPSRLEWNMAVEMTQSLCCNCSFSCWRGQVTEWELVNGWARTDTWVCASKVCVLEQRLICNLWHTGQIQPSACFGVALLSEWFLHF